MMEDKDIKEFHDLDKLNQYHPLPSGLTVADSRISGQGLFRTPLGGFINHSDEPNCQRSQVRVKPGYDKWSIMTLEDIEEGDELTLKYKLYDPKR